MNILIGVTGSIAIYKSCQLVRLFLKEGHKVRVVMSKSAKKFISPLTFEALTGEPVLEEGSENWHSEVNHIGYARWADIYIIAPATANTINKARGGVGDTLPLQVYLATDAPTLFAPSANTKMYLHWATQKSLEKLRYVTPGTGELACKEVGIGKMAEPIDIYWEALRVKGEREFWRGKRVAITGGGSREPIDDVRFIGNYSSGKMGEALALAFYQAGADPVLITSTPPRQLPSQIPVVPVEKATDYREAILDSAPDYLVMAAAIVDYVPPYRKGKIKKEEMGEKLELILRKNIDVLESLKEFPFKKIGFKAEYDEVQGRKSALKALRRKGLDAICLNYLGRHNFGSDKNEVYFITPNWEVKIPEGSKLEVARKIVELAELV
jgi:phosphopantothenoylcysteine decarboxylase/phosphopantothenate--cysteine ligase